MKSLVLSAIQKYVSSRGSFRFWRRVIFCVFFAVSLIHCPIAASVPSENASDAAQTNTISKEKKVRVGYYHSINFSEGMSDTAVKSGLAYDYLQRVSYYTNWNYEYVYGGWSDILQMLYSGEIDVMAGVSKTPERLDKILFPDYSMGAENYYIYANVDHPLSSQGISSIAGCTVSVNKDSIMEGLLADWNDSGNRQINIKTSIDTTSRYEDFNAKKVDATVDTDNAIPAESHMIPIAKIGQSEYYLAVNKNRPDLLAELNTALDKLTSTTPYFTKTLANNYFSNLSVSANLSPDELKWLTDHPNITIGYLDDYLPLCDTDKNGKPTGCMTDIINEMLQELKIQDKVNLTYVPYASYSNLLSDLRLGAIDVAFPINNDVALAEKNNIYLTNEIISTPMYLIYYGEFSPAKGRYIAAKRGNSIADIYIRNNFPDAEAIYYDKITDMLDAVAAQKVDGCILNAFRKDAYLLRSSYQELKAMPLKARAHRSFAVRHGNTELLSILNRGITVIPSEFVLTATNAYTSQMNVLTFKDYLLRHITTVMTVSGCIIAIFSVLTAYSFIMRRTRKRIEYIAHHDSLTGLFNRLSFNEALPELEKKRSTGDIIVVAMDLNDLKRINDGLGHEAGDEILKGASDCMKRILDRHGNVYRLGGDEFMAVLFNDTENWLDILTRLKNAFSSWEGAHVKKLTVAVGAAQSSGNSFESINEMIAAADQEMYKDKAAYYERTGIDRRR